MADTFTVLLTGGKCAGKTKDVTADVIRSGKTWCQGQLYVLVIRRSSEKYPFTFEFAGDLGGTDTSISPTPVTQAWTRWMHALGHTGPRAHRRIVKSTARINRIARKR